MPSKRNKLIAVAFGVVLVAGPIAHAGPERSPVAELRARLERAVTLHEGVGKLLDNPRATSKLSVLHWHHEEFVPRGSILTLASHGDARLTYDGEKLSVLRREHTRAPTVDDMVAFGIEGPTDFARVVLRLLHEVAGVPLVGDASAEHIDNVVREKVQAAGAARQRSVEFVDQHSLYALLRAHHEKVVNAKSRVTGHQYLAGDQQDGILLNPNASLVWNRRLFAVDAGVLALANTHDLARHGLDEAHIETALKQRVLDAAGVRGAPDDAAAVRKAADILRARIDDTNSLVPYLRDADKHPDGLLLMTHQEKVVMARQTAIDNFPMSERNGQQIVIGRKIYTTVRHGDTHDKATLADFAEHGIGTGAEFDARLAELVLARAGMSGQPADPATIERARDVLRGQVAEVDRLEAITKDALLHPDLGLVVRAYRAMQRDPHATARTRIVLAEQNDQKLIVDLRSAQLEVETAGTTSAAQFATLVAFGLDRNAAFDAAMEKVLTKIAPEDLEPPSARR